MEPTALLAVLQGVLPGVQFEPSPSADAHPTIYAPPGDISAVLQALRDHPELDFKLLLELTAVDYLPREPRFEVVYILASIERRQRMRLKVRLAGGSPRLATASGLWPAANWLEREVWDMFGIEFERHPDPRRLLMPEDWDGYPLRKDYPVQINLPARVTEPMQVSEEQFRSTLERDRLARRD
jgi:NADH-quinone oxidoreductase subunit C